MFKLETQFAHFRFNAIHRVGPYQIRWFKLHNDRQGTCFSKEELDVFMGFILLNPVNFPDGSISHQCTEEEGPYCSVRPLIRHIEPINVILKVAPQINGQTIFPCMNIILTDANGHDNHNYNLEFDVIGQIIAQR